MVWKDDYENGMPGAFPSSDALESPEKPPLPSINIAEHTTNDAGSDTETEFLAPTSIRRSAASKAKQSVNSPLALPGSSKTRKPVKVALKPGFSPLDWAQKVSSKKSFPPYRKVKPSELKLHNKRADAWGAFNNRVYDLTEYMDYHPGGVRELLRAAGRDGTALFLEYHPWINIEALLGVYYIGKLVNEDGNDTV